MAKLDTHPAAQAEYEAAIRWYAQQSTAAARRFVGEVEAAMRANMGHPESY
jgi:plasmid stabilization system protein ParE